MFVVALKTQAVQFLIVRKRYQYYVQRVAVKQMPWVSTRWENAGRVECRFQS